MLSGGEKTLEFLIFSSLVNHSILISFHEVICCDDSTIRRGKNDLESENDRVEVD